jgi:MFS family permease
MATNKFGSCSTCGYSPLAFDAACCPRCGGQNTCQTRLDRFVGRGMLAGILGGILLGVALGVVAEWPPGAGDRGGAAIAGGLILAIPGLFVGLVVGLVAAVVADLTGRPMYERAGGFVVPEAVVIRYCGRCRRQQPVADGNECTDCGRPTVPWAAGRETEAEALRRWVAADSGPRNPGR